MSINLQELRQEIIKMTPRKNIYKALKEELTKQGHWRNYSRGNPIAGRKAQLASMSNADNIGAGGDTIYETYEG